MAVSTVGGDPYPGECTHSLTIPTFCIHTICNRLERMVNNMVDEETGPLEAVIRNLQHEIDTKGVESQELQRRWIVYQTELVQLQVWGKCGENVGEVWATVLRGAGVLRNAVA